MFMFCSLEREGFNAVLLLQRGRKKGIFSVAMQQSSGGKNGG
jgi:hypothetical protein